MAQRKLKKKKTVMAQAWVQAPTPSLKSPVNDNKQLATSGLRFREQKVLEKRAEDLSWQLRFAQMKLHHWSNVDNLNWEPLDNLKKFAEKELAGLSLA